MKVALLSFHNAYNYGAALQAYALQEAISEFGIQAEYIDYVNEHRLVSYDMRLMLKKAIKEKNIKKSIRVLLGMPFIACRKRNFDSFYSNHLRTTRKRYTSSSEAEELNAIYDKFIVGSDQVWNPCNNGNDTAYLLDFVKNKEKCVAYSPSFGVDVLPNDIKKKYSDCLARFAYLGVREMKGVELVEELIDRKPELLLDPVFLIKKEKWESFFEKKEDNDYVFFYTNNKDEIKDFISTGYSLKKLKSHILCTRISPFDFLKSRNKIVVSMGVNDFLSEIYNAKIIVTSSFHCVAFSILFNKPFVCVLSGNHGKDERLINLLSLCNLRDRILSVDTTIDDINKPIDYDNVSLLIERYVNKSKEFLMSALFSTPVRKTYLSDQFSSNVCCQDDRCTGCGVCGEVCPQHAISFKYNSEGYLTPQIKRTLCTDCGLCKKHCQVFSQKPKLEEEQEFWCVKNTEEIRKMSSSGGAFYSIAREILVKNGVVVAAELNSDYKVQHVIIDNYKQLDRVMGTFYVQSDCFGIYTKVRDILDEKKQVLFVGTPCQVNGLRCYLGKEYSNLLLCDLVCHGVPGQHIFDKFIDYLRTRGEMKNYKFRDKENGWRGYTESVIINNKKYIREPWLTSYTAMFTKNKINRKSCAQCSYSNIIRCGDITIGDFWTIGKYHKILDDGYGVSMVMCNTKKGKDFFSNVNFLYKSRVEEDKVTQKSLVEPSNMAKDRLRTIRAINEKGYGVAAKRYGYNNIEGYIRINVQYILQRLGIL